MSKTHIFKSGYHQKSVGTRSCPTTPLVITRSCPTTPLVITRSCSSICLLCCSYWPNSLPRPKHQNRNGCIYCFFSTKL